MIYSRGKKETGDEVLFIAGNVKVTQRILVPYMSLDRVRTHAGAGTLPWKTRKQAHHGRDKSSIDVSPST
jgi:hypothetical protein